MQRRRHRVEHVGRADEQHLRQIERHVQIVVAEGVVLLRVQRFQQRRGRIAAEVAAQLVHLVQHDHRVVGFGAANALDDLAGQRADVGPAMAANLGLVVHAAQRNALELAAQRAGNRPAEAGFAHAGRPDEAQNRPLHVGLQFAHAQVIQNPVLHLFQLVVVLVQNLLGHVDVDLRSRALGPGQDGQPLDVVARERVVGGHGRHAREARELFHGLFLHVLGHPRLIDLLAQLLDLALALVLLAQLLLDGLELLAQVVVALRLLHLVLHLGLDLGAQLLHLDLLGQKLVQLLQPVHDAGRFQQLLLVVGGQEGQRRSHKIHQPGRLLDVRGDGPQFVGERRRLGDDLLELLDDVAHQGFKARRGRRRHVLQRLHLGHHKGLGLGIAHQAHAAYALGKDKTALVGHAHNFVHGGQGSHGVQIGRLGRVQARIQLRRHHDLPAPRPAIRSTGWSSPGPPSAAVRHEETGPYRGRATPEFCAFLGCSGGGVRG